MSVTHCMWLLLIVGLAFVLGTTFAGAHRRPNRHQFSTLVAWRFETFALVNLLMLQFLRLGRGWLLLKRPKQ